MLAREADVAAPEAAGGAARPLVKWAGGKRSLIRQLQRFVPPRLGTYYEPFLGGAAFFFALAPTPAVIGDSNADLIALYEAVRDYPEAVIEALDRVQPRVLEADFYYRVRAQVAEALEPPARAARFIYLNKTCYNGLYRVNRAGQFNVPFGRYARPPALYARDNLLSASRLLAAAELRCSDFEATLSAARAGDFVYLDPPYAPLTRTANFTRYTVESFEDGEQRRLARCVRDLDARGCLVLLSNSDTPAIRALYRGFRMEVVHAPRNINSDATARGRIPELAIANYDLQAV